MNKSVLISIRPNWCDKIASGRKTLEIRKTRPKLQPPFKCYIYQTMTGYVSKSKENDILVPIAYGKVIGEFVCDEIEKKIPIGFDENWHYWNVGDEFTSKSCITEKEMLDYSNNSVIYGWNISELKIYDSPKELLDFGLSRPPQSWRYINR